MHTNIHTYTYCTCIHVIPKPTVQTAYEYCTYWSGLLQAKVKWHDQSFWPRTNKVHKSYIIVVHTKFSWCILDEMHGYAHTVSSTQHIRGTYTYSNMLTYVQTYICTYCTYTYSTYIHGFDIQARISTQKNVINQQADILPLVMRELDALKFRQTLVLRSCLVAYVRM